MIHSSIRCGILGVGSCASSLLQTVHAAKMSSGAIPGVPHQLIGRYSVADIHWTAAFDANRAKVGQDLAVAALSEHNAAIRHVDVPDTGVPVVPGPLCDGLTGPLSDVVVPHPSCAEMSFSEVTEHLVESRTKVLVCLLPTGARQAIEGYAAAAAKANCAFINGTPEPVANHPELSRLFEWNCPG